MMFFTHVLCVHFSHDALSITSWLCSNHANNAMAVELRQVYSRFEYDATRLNSCRNESSCVSLQPKSQNADE